MTTPRLALAICSGVIAASALGGSVAMMTGLIDLGSDINGRLPFGSPVLAALALATIVAVPMGAVTWYSLHDRARTRQIAVAAGALLVGWIGVQLVVIHTFSWLQPAMAAAGTAVLAAGLLDRRNVR